MKDRRSNDENVLKLLFLAFKLYYLRVARRGEKPGKKQENRVAPAKNPKN